MEIKANDTNRVVAKKMKRKVKSLSAPNLFNMYSLELNDIHKTVYYFNTKEERDAKIEKLNSDDRK